MKIRYLPHTADVRMIIESETLQELFATGVKGMGNILKEGFCDHYNTFNKSARIETHSLDHTSLLIDFLSDVLSLSYVEKSIYCKVHLLQFSSKKIVAEVYGTTIDEFDEEIKAVTYHEADVQKNSDNNWETHIIFDI